MSVLSISRWLILARGHKRARTHTLSFWPLPHIPPTKAEEIRWARINFVFFSFSLFFFFLFFPSAPFLWTVIFNQVVYLRCIPFSVSLAPSLSFRSPVPFALSKRLPMVDLKKPVLTYPFWCGGAAASMAACVTHPLDLLRVRMQTSQIKTGFGSTAVSVFKANGVPGFYSGLSASIMRQMTYSVTRFGAYEYFKDVFRQRNPGSKLTPMQMILAASLAGVAGGIAGNPADIILVRMTADASKPPAERLNYKHCFDGVFRVVKEEGVQQLFRGLGPNLVRAVLMNASQLASYDWFKEQLIARLDFKDGLFLHSMASLGAGTVATTICAPADVVRSRVMNSKSTEGPVSVLLKSLKSEGPQFLFKGWTPAWIRLAPNTVLIFIFLEQIRKVVDSTRTIASA